MEVKVIHHDHRKSRCGGGLVRAWPGCHASFQAAFGGPFITAGSHVVIEGMSMVGHRRDNFWAFIFTGEAMWLQVCSRQRHLVVYRMRVTMRVLSRVKGLDRLQLPFPRLWPLGGGRSDRTATTGSRIRRSGWFRGRIRRSTAIRRGGQEPQVP